jgi:hypothetical protein
MDLLFYSWEIAKRTLIEKTKENKFISSCANILFLGKENNWIVINIKEKNSLTFLPAFVIKVYFVLGIFFNYY